MSTILAKISGTVYTTSPRWFIITKKMVSNITTFTIAILMILGHRADDITLLIIKLTQSFIMETLDSFMSSDGQTTVAPEVKTP